MSETSIRDAALRRELGVPPTFDLFAHLREIVRVAVPAGLAAAILSIGVFVVRDAGPGVYESVVVAEVRTSAPFSGGDANLGQLTAPYVALSTDGAVVADIAKQMANGWDAGTVSSHLTVTPGTSPALVLLKSTGGSQDEADTLARVAVASLDQAQAMRRQEALDSRIVALDANIERLMTELERSGENAVLRMELDTRLDQRRELTATDAGPDQLQLLSSPEGTGQKVSPRPAAEAAVAFLIGFVLIAELLAALNGRFGNATSDAWARRIARRYRTALQIEHSEARGLPLGTVVMLHQRAALGDNVLVLGTAGVAMDPEVFSETVSPRIKVLPLDSAWWKETHNGDVALALVVVAADAEDRELVERSLRALTEVDIPIRLVLVGPSLPNDLLGMRGGKPRRSATVPVLPMPGAPPAGMAPASNGPPFEYLPRQAPQPGQQHMPPPGQQQHMPPPGQQQHMPPPRRQF